MPRHARSDVPEETWIEVLTPHFRGEQSLGVVREELEKRGFKRTTSAIMQAKSRFASKIMSMDITYHTAPADGLPSYILQDLNALDTTIRDLNAFIESISKTIPTLNSVSDVKERTYALQAIKVAKECYEARIKAYVTKVQILSERRTIIQKLSINKNYSKEELDDIGATYYQMGFEEAKKIFLEECNRCKGPGARIIEAAFKMVKPNEKGKSAEVSGDKGEVPEGSG